MTSRAEQLAGTIERRSVRLDDFEVRESRGMLEFSGYASLFDTPYDIFGGPTRGGFTETVDRRAFDATLKAKPDVVLNMDHGDSGSGLPIARTTSGTLQLRTDSKGLLPSASLDLRDPDVQLLQVKVERGDVNQMSFAFRTIRDAWDDDTTRQLVEVSLDRGDVSIVTNGALDKTSVKIRALDDALRCLTDIDPMEALAEVRSLEDGDPVELLLDARSKLNELVRALQKPSERRMTFAEADRVIAASR
jgi:HK97 family phage prohead protease